MRDFVRDVFARAGAAVADEAELLRVRLPAAEEGLAAELAAAFGRDDLALVFDAGDLQPGAELVAPGSHVLRVLEEALARTGRRSYVLQPGGERLTLARVRERLRAAAGLVFGLEDRQTARGYTLYVVYRVRYKSLERIDALETVGVTVLPGEAPRAALAEPPAEVDTWDARPRKQAPDDLLRPALEAADALVTGRAREEARRLGAEARRESLTDLSRIHAYYAAQVAEWQRSRRRDLALIRIEELEEERELRLRELAAATRVSAEVEPLQLLTVEVPLQEARLTLRPRGQRRAPEDPGVLVRFDRATGDLHLPACAACAADLAGGRLDACAAGHVAHDTCTSPCGRCDRKRCAACGEAVCAACDATLCPACVTACRTCARTICPEHVASCAVCLDEACEACLQSCAACGSLACPADRHPAGSGSQASFCVRCALPCPGCRTATALDELSRCPRCGRRFCPDCRPADAELCVLCREADH